VKVHPEAKPFRNKGWPYLRKMAELMPTTPAGINVYHAASAPPPTSSQPPASLSVDSDDESDHPPAEEPSNESSDVEEVSN